MNLVLSWCAMGLHVVGIVRGSAVLEWHSRPRHKVLHPHTQAHSRAVSMCLYPCLVTLGTESELKGWVGGCLMQVTVTRTW
jgi:hypothetical protein